MPRFFLMVIAINLLLASFEPVYAQQGTQQTYSREEIEQLVAPIALYPDKLLAQIFMACTYPLEIVNAARFVQANPGLKDEKLKDALKNQNWDESVKALTTVPQVLQMLNEKLDMTQKLGDAFLAQQKDVIDAVQSLRARAQGQGNLVSGNEQSVNNTVQGDKTYITIEPTNPEMVYVPTYDPNAIYGEWPYPSYPPYSYYPSGYVAGRPGLWFGAGFYAGSALWGRLDWHNGDVDIDAGRFNDFNGTNIGDGKWRHRVEHRRGVQYRDRATQHRYGRGQQEGIRAREEFRGRVDHRDLTNRGDTRNRVSTGGRFDGQRQDFGRQGDRGGFRQQERASYPSQRQSRYGSSGGRQGMFEGVNRGTQQRNYSRRGYSSRSSFQSRGSRGGGARYGGGRSGGGRSRGGGGRRR